MTLKERIFKAIETYLNALPAEKRSTYFDYHVVIQWKNFTTKIPLFLVSQKTPIFLINFAENLIVSGFTIQDQFSLYLENSKNADRFESLVVQFDSTSEVLISDSQSTAPVSVVSSRFFHSKSEIKQPTRTPRTHYMPTIPEDGPVIDPEPVINIELLRCKSQVNLFDPK